jgi:hypothetical protein
MHLLIPIVLAVVVGCLSGLSVIGSTGPRVPASY